MQTLTTTPSGCDLDTAHFAHVAIILRNAANSYRASAEDLASTWQDESAGLIWKDLARILDRAADQADRAVIKRGLA